jgi:hypothetical protein
MMMAVDLVYMGMALCATLKNLCHVNAAIMMIKSFNDCGAMAMAHFNAISHGMELAMFLANNMAQY